MRSAILALLTLSSLFGLGSAAGRKVSAQNKNWDYTYPYKRTPVGDYKWYYGSATYYDLSGITGACGQPWSVLNKVDYAAVPDPRFSNYVTAGAGTFLGAACGQCYQVKCINVPRYAQTVFCKHTRPITVKITDADAPDRNWPNNHFDLKPRSFAKIADPSAGIINIQFRRVKCAGWGAKWYLSPNTNGFYKELIIYDVPSIGSIIQVWVKPGGKSNWIKGKRLWGTHFTWMGTGGNYDRSAKVTIVFAESWKSAAAKYVPTS